LPPRPIWHPFTSRNPNYAPTGDTQDPYSRTSIPPVYARQTGAGAVYYEGASYEDRVVPPAVRDMASRDAPPGRERARSQSDQRDHSVERRNRRRDGESDRARRRRDRHRRDTLDDVDGPPVLSGEPPLVGNALGIHPASLRPGLGQYSSAPPPVTSTSDTSTSRVGGAPSSRPPTSHGMAPPITATSSVPGSTYREVSQNNGTDSYRSRRDTISRPSSTPIGPVLSSWVAPDLANPSLNSLGLSAPAHDVGGFNLQAARASSASIPLTTRNSVSSWGTADSAPGQNDIFSTLRPLASAPADSDHSPSDLLPRADGQLLGTGRSGPIATPQPRFPQIPMPQTFRGASERDSDSRPYSAYGRHAHSQSQTSLPSVRDSSQPPVPPPPFTPADRGFPYASVPPMPPYSMVTPAPRPSSSHSFPMPIIPPLPYLSAPPVNTATRPPNNTSQTSLPGVSVSQSQHTNYRPHH